MLTTRNETPAPPLNSMLAALRWIDRRLEYVERRSMYHYDVDTNRATFMVDKPYPFEAGDHLRTDIGMAGFFGNKALLTDDSKLSTSALSELSAEGFSISAIVCVGDDVSSWIVVGKHFALEMRNSKFD